MLTFSSKNSNTTNATSSSMKLLVNALLISSLDAFTSNHHHVHQTRIQNKDAMIDNTFVMTPRSSKRKRRSASTQLRALDVVSTIANDYNYFLSNFPLQTQSGTAGFLTGIGDILAQAKEGGDGRTTSEEEQQQKSESTLSRIVQLIDLDRTRSFMLKGLGAGIIWNSWYHIADGWTNDILFNFGIDQDIDAFAAVYKTLISISLEQFVACPIVYALWDIPVPRLLSGEKPSAIPKTVVNKLPSLLVENAKVWTFVNIIIYNVPLEFRVLALSTADVFWQAIMSSSITSEEEEEEKATARTIEE